MTYITLGPRGPVTGTKDNTGNNTGKWTIAFTPAILAFTVPQIEVNKIAAAGAPGTTFNIYIESKLWASNVYGVQNEWEDTNGNLVIRPGETLYFYYSDFITDNTPPVVTVFIRYDPSLAQNPGSLHGLDQPVSTTGTSRILRWQPPKLITASQHRDYSV